MAVQVFPEKHIKDAAVNVMKRFLSRHAAQISTELARFSTLPDSDRRAAINSANLQLRRLLQLHPAG
jgi:hypothetical protein